MSSVQCQFKADHAVFKLRKTCIIQNQVLGSAMLNVEFNKKPIRRDDGNTTAIAIKECKIRTWPCFNALHLLIPNLECITIKQCSLRKLEKENFEGLFCLKELIITGNKIMCLPWDLFNNTPNIEALCLKRNSIKYIDEGIFDPLRNLKLCDLSENFNINAKFDASKSPNGAGFLAFKAEIKMRCSIRATDMINELECAAGFSSVREARGSGSEVDSRKLLGKQQEIDDLRAQVRYWMNRCTDFTINVGGIDFQVHKSTIMEASPIIKGMIEDTPEAKNLILQDISVSTFKSILDYMYEKKPLDVDNNLVELCGACFKLGMDNLAKIASKALTRTVKRDNSYEVLVLCNQYDLEELRVVAFKEFKKNFPNKKVADEIAKQPEALKKIMKAKLAMDEALALIDNVD